MATYADTSFLVSLYVQDALSPKAQNWLTGHPANFPLTEFGRTELRNAIARLAFTKAFSHSQADAAWKLVEADITQGRLEPIAPPWPAIFAKAEELVAKHTVHLGTRTLDALHVATALVLGDPDFVSFDPRQGEMAKVAGLNWQLPP